MPLYDQTNDTIFSIVGLGRNTGDFICKCRQIHYDCCSFDIQK